MDLVVLSGGMGSRFGGAKQIEGIDASGNFIMDYSIYDAKRAGFDRAVIIIKPEHFDIFESTIGKRLAKKIPVKYVFQTVDLPILKNAGIVRQKPLGTAEAILRTREVVNDNFCIVNADDFYGKDSFFVASKYLKNLDKNSTNFALVGYKLVNTLSDSGAVKRGICNIENGFVNSIDECSVEHIGDKVIAHSIITNNEVLVSPNEVTSMNMFCLTPKVFDYLDKEFKKFANDRKNLESGEYLLPREICQMVAEKLATVKALETDEKWIGMTYKDDKQSVVDGIKKLADCGIYPHN